MNTQRKKRSKTVELSDITTVILAGGRGTRLRPAVSDKPKVLAEVCGRPFLSYLLDQLCRACAKEVVLCTGYMGDMVQKTYGDTYKSLHLLYSLEAESLDTGGAIRLAAPLFKSDVVLVMNGDSHIDADLCSYVGWFFEKDRQASILLARVSETGRYGMVKVGKDESILDFEEKGVAIGAGWINAGVYLLKKFLLRSFPLGKSFSLEHELFPSLVRKGLFGRQCKGRFIDIGTPESYATAEKCFGENKMNVVENNAHGGEDL